MRRNIPAIPAVFVILLLTTAWAGARRVAEAGGRADESVEAPALPLRAEHGAALARLDSAAAAAFEAAGAGALERAVNATDGLAERGVFLADEPDARGYRIEVGGGDEVEVVLGVADATVPVFLELLDARSGAVLASMSAGRPAPAAAPTPGTTLRHRAARPGVLLVRLQAAATLPIPYDIRIRRRSALVFPVAGADLGKVIGHYLEPRDGGARLHQGIDIGAPSGTPVLAAADGKVTRVENTPAGGLVVWVVERGSGRTHYYAHLKEQRVRAGQSVRRGDVVGTVGNTGNAVNTPPHLHYSVHVGGRALNPAKLFTRSDERTAQLPALDSLVGRLARTRVSGGALRPGPGQGAHLLTLGAGAKVEVLAVADRFYRIRVAGRHEGYVAQWLLSAAD